jgi:hypothetical protein
MVRRWPLKGLALAFAITTQGQSLPPWYGGRVFTSAALHVGLRPAVLVAPDELALGFTMQVTVR